MSDSMGEPMIHPSAFVEEGAVLEEGVKVWHLAQVRTGAHLQKGVSVGKDVYVDSGVRVGDYSRIQNGVNVYNGVEIGKYCFIGPGVTFTNDRYPRIGRKNWDVVKTVLEDGCSLGAGAIIRCGIHIGAFAMVGSGSVVTRNIPDFSLVTGIPAHPTHRICACADTIIPLISFDGVYIRDCCRRNLEKSVLELAENIIQRGQVLPLKTGTK